MLEGASRTAPQIVRGIAAPKTQPEDATHVAPHDEEADNESKPGNKGWLGALEGDLLSGGRAVLDIGRIYAGEDK